MLTNTVVSAPVVDQRRGYGFPANDIEHRGNNNCRGPGWDP